MITDDEIMRLYELADPARDDDGSRMLDAAGYLDALQTRSYDMQLIDTPEAPTKSPRDNRWVLTAIAAAAIVLIVAGALLLTRDDGDEVPASPPTTMLSQVRPFSLSSTMPLMNGLSSIGTPRLRLTLSHSMSTPPSTCS